MKEFASAVVHAKAVLDACKRARTVAESDFRELLEAVAECREVLSSAVEAVEVVENELGADGRLRGSPHLRELVEDANLALFDEPLDTTRAIIEHRKNNQLSH